MTTTQPTCQCLVNPNWRPSVPVSPLPDIKIDWPEIKIPPINLTTPNGLTPEEQSVLKKLVDSWNEFIAMGSHTSDDIQEFRDAIHRCQQLIALRVARRVDEHIWRQPL